MDALFPSLPAVLAADTSSSTAHAAVASSVNVAKGSQLAYCNETGTCPSITDNAWGDLDTTPHVWTGYGPPGSIMPDEGSYYAGLHQVNGSQLAYCNQTGTCPSITDNAFGDLDTTPHVWTGYGPPGSIMPDEGSYYAGLHQVNGSQLAYCNQTGTCPSITDNAWGDLDTTPHVWTGYGPPGSIMPDEGSYYAGLHQTKVALAVPAGAETVKSDSSQKSETKTRPSPGHFLLMGHAMIFGAASATSELVEDCVSGKKDAWSKWQANFSEKSKEAAESVTPIGGFVLKTHILKQ